MAVELLRGKLVCETLSGHAVVNIFFIAEKYPEIKIPLSEHPLLVREGGEINIDGLAANMEITES